MSDLRDALATALRHVEVPLDDPATGHAWSAIAIWRYYADAILSDPAFREAVVEAVGTAMTWIEDEKRDAHPECLTDTCGHDVCPDWGCLGCGDARAIVDRMLA